MNTFFHLFLLLFLSFQEDKRGITSPEVESKGIAVVELFTSQGCSSCPPADAYLSQLVDEAEKEGKAIYPLSFHVDYWNYLGWKDPYSQESYSERQYAYARGLGERVYTPQMIINGKDVFVGSDRRKGNVLIPIALGTPAKHTVRLSIQSGQKGSLTVQYQIEGDLKDQLLNLAVVKDRVSDQVSRGENRGRTLTHQHVVRSFQSIPLKSKEGMEKIMIPQALSDLSLVAYVQNKNSWQIGGATAVPLTKTLN